MESLIKNLPGKKPLGPDIFPGEFFQIFKGETMPILYKFFQKIEKQKTLPSLFYKADINVITKPNILLYRESLTYDGSPYDFFFTL